MKRLFTILTLIACSLALRAQMTQLTINADATAMQNPDCWLGQGTLPQNKAYIHSGLCTNGQQFCNDSISGYNSPVWEHVVGNWGVDDSIGLMTYQGNGIWSITFIIEQYYAQNISVGTPMSQGATPYTIGLVLRDLDGTNEGKDNLCQDIFIVDINTSSPRVIEGSTGQTFSPITVQKTIVGVEEAGWFAYLRVSPNPFREAVRVEYNLLERVESFSVRVLNALGQEVAVLADGVAEAGPNTLRWDGRDRSGGLAANGLYHLVLSDGGKPLATEKIMLVR